MSLCSAHPRASRQPHPVEIDIDIEAQPQDDDQRETQVFLPAVSGEVAEPIADVAAPSPDVERADRIFWNAAVLSADQAARFEHQRRVVAPLLMLLALGLLFAAGKWSC